MAGNGRRARSGGRCICGFVLDFVSFGTVLTEMEVRWREHTDEAVIFTQGCPDGFRPDVYNGIHLWGQRCIVVWVFAHYLKHVDGERRIQDWLAGC